MQTYVEKVNQWLHAHLGKSTQLASAVNVSKQIGDHDEEIADGASINYRSTERVLNKRKMS